MIILPNTPPTPIILQGNAPITPQLKSTRAALVSASTESYNDLVRYVVNLEEYIEQLCQFAVELSEATLPSVVQFSSTFSLQSLSPPPWLNLVFFGDEKNLQKLKISKPKGDWYLINELELSLLSIALIYVRLGGELINELIESDDDNMQEINEKWKQVINFYKRAISFTKFGFECNGLYDGENHLNGILFNMIERIGFICIQMSILCKSSWMNRLSYDASESFKSNNNGTLSRVAIYVIDELKNCKSLLGDVQANSRFTVRFNTNDWNDYLALIEKYANAYAGLFLSIETYQQSKLGQAIGLLNFCLVNLQSKSISEISPKTSKLIRIKSKFSGKKNETYIKNLESITTLNLNKSLFHEKSGIILKDINYVFDLLIMLHLRFTKENDNLVFDKVTSYQDIHKDGRWPIGSKIPISDIIQFSPHALDKPVSQSVDRAYF